MLNTFTFLEMLADWTKPLDYGVCTTNQTIKITFNQTWLANFSQRGNQWRKLLEKKKKNYSKNFKTKSDDQIWSKVALPTII